MKKTLLAFLVGTVIGFALGTVNWKSLVPFSGSTYGVASPNLESYGLSGFGLAEPPEFSSKQFFFRTGFTDVGEYWSFVLPPGLAREFVDSYAKRQTLTRVPATSDFPDWINRHHDHDAWKQEYWFNEFEDLSEIYYRQYLFLGYSEEKNRIYLMNWND